MALFSAQSSLDNEEQINAPVLKGLWAGLDERNKYHILELGAASAGNIDFFGTRRCRIRVLDALRELADLGRDGAWRDLEEDAQGAALEQALAERLPADDAEKADLALFWDVLNYLDRPVLKALAQHLSSDLLEPGARLHAFVAPMDAIALYPAHYDILEAGRLRVRREARGTRPGPRYHQPELERLMPQFVVERSVLLGNGIQEYLFRHEPLGAC